MIFLFILSSIIGVLLGYFVILDIKDLQNNLLNSTNIIILANSNIKTGLIIAIGGENTTILTDDELMNYQQSYINKDYKSILSNRFKLIIIKTRILNNLLPEKEIINGIELDKQTLINLTETDDIRLYLGSKGVKDEQITLLKTSLNLKEDNQLKSLILIPILKNLNPTVLIKEYKSENIILYPETITFKLFKFIPNSLISIVANQVKTA